MLKFNSQIQIRDTLPDFTQVQVKNEPMLFSCDAATAWEKGSDLTRSFLEILPDEFADAKDLVIDSRVHMLMPNWYPCIPGFHHDDVPRERQDGQPNYKNPSYHAKHCLVLVGDCCPTEFAVGEAEFPDVELGQTYYKVWHPMVKEKIQNKQLQSVMAPSNRLVFFDAYTWHQGTPAIKNGWRWFVRATINTGRKPTNELRRQVQVYLENPMEGW